MYAPFKPMLLKSDEDLKHIGNPLWIAQRKWDGERIVCVKQGSSVELWNRRGNNKTKAFPEIVQEMHDNPNPYFTVDGEVVYIEDDMDTFTIQQRRSATTDPGKAQELQAQYPLNYIVFDILELEGVDLRNRKLKERLETLNHIIPVTSHISPSEVLPNTMEMYEFACANGWEGLVLKNLNGIYTNEKRTSVWLKAKCWKEYTSIVIGVSKGKGARADIMGALLLGVPENNGFRYVGKAGSFSGVTQGDLVEIHRTLESVSTQQRPNISNIRKIKLAEVKFWTEPLYEVDIRVGEITADGIYRFPTFIRMKLLNEPITPVKSKPKVKAKAKKTKPTPKKKQQVIIKPKGKQIVKQTTLFD